MSMVTKKNWEEFRNTGLLWWINTQLHMFGWAIVCEFDENSNLSEAYPARVKFRGFGEKLNDVGYRKVSNYLLENIVELEEEARG